MFATDCSFNFSCTRDFVTRIEIEEEQDKSFLSSIILIGTVQIHWFKLITSK